MENGSTNTFKVGDTIKILNGIYVDQIQVVESVDEEKGLVTFKTILFGREQDVIISVNDIEKYSSK